MATEARMSAKLTRKQRQFVQEYLLDYSASAAARRAGYSKRTARVIGFENLTKPAIAAEISRVVEEKKRFADITRERVLEEMRRLAFAQMTDMVTLKGGWVVVKDTESLTTEQKSAISQIRQKKDGEIEVKFYDKQKSLEMLAKYLGIFSDANTGQSPGVQPQINIVFGEAPAAAIVEGEVRELPEGGDNG